MKKISRINSQKGIFALNDEQKALLDEWNNLKERMDKAQMIFLFDENYISLGVVNGEKIAEVHTDEVYYDEDYYEYLEDDAVEWGNFELPNVTTFYDGEYSPFFLFDDGKEKRMIAKSMQSAAL